MRIYLSEEIAKQILESKGDEVEISLDLGKSKNKVKKRLFHNIPLEKVRGDFAYFWNGKRLFKIAIPGAHYYRLRMFKGFPILEIDGLRMQLVRDFRNPLEYSKRVVNMLGVKRGDYVLDTCTGLGYTAIAVYKMWGRVLSFEKDTNVLEIAKENPWSSELFNNKDIEVLKEDVFCAVKKLEDEKFDKILHDPPRFSLAGELYSLEFYSQLFRIAKKGAKLFHYVGSVGRKSGARIEKGVMERLEKAGWKKIKYNKKLQGVFAEKI